jgi:hypothetical protein
MTEPATQSGLVRARWLSEGSSRRAIRGLFTAREQHSRLQFQRSAACSFPHKLGRRGTDTGSYGKRCCHGITHPHHIPFLFISILNTTASFPFSRTIRLLDRAGYI